jgi:hypothetical protein
MARVIFTTQPQYTFGVMTTRLVTSLIQANASVARVQAGMTTASNGFTGTAGTQYEISGSSTGMGNPMAPINLFGVIADANNLGANGTAYETAMNTIETAWQTFWTAASGALQTLDNGSTTVP